MSIEKNFFLRKKVIDVFKQPKSFYLIFSIELWERFGYYGLQSIFIIYLVKMLNFSESDSITLFSSFSALVYGFVAIGGWLGDKVLGTKRVIILGILVLIIGYSIIAFFGSQFYIYLGMSTIAVGSGLFKANPSSLLSSCYKKNDSRLDGAFTMYYMAINIGSFLSMLIAPWLASNYGWSVAFSLSVVGMFITIINFLLCQNYIKDFGSSPDFIKLKWLHLLYVILGILFFIFFSSWLLHYQKIVHIILILVIVGVLTVFFYQTIYLDYIERSRILVAFILILESLFFFILYNQMPTSINLFTIHNVETSFLGFHFKPEQFQALNPFLIIFLSPLVTIGYSRFGKWFSIPFKFSIGMMFCSLSFLILTIGAFFSKNTGIVSIYWLIFSYIFQSTGELMISGLGLSMIAKFVPKHLVGFVMGIWFLSSASAVMISGFIANLSVALSEVNKYQDSLQIYSHMFMKIGIFSGIIAILMLFFAPKLNRISQI